MSEYYYEEDIEERMKQEAQLVGDFIKISIGCLGIVTVLVCILVLSFIGAR